MNLMPGVMDLERHVSSLMLATNTLCIMTVRSAAIEEPSPYNAFQHQKFRYLPGVRRSSMTKPHIRTQLKPRRHQVLRLDTVL